MLSHMSKLYSQKKRMNPLIGHSTALEQASVDLKIVHVQSQIAYLMTLKQKESMSLRDYIERLSRQRSEVEDALENLVLVAPLSGYSHKSI